MIYEIHHVDGIAMLDQDGAGRSQIEVEFEQAALIEQRIRALVGAVGMIELAARGGKLDA